MNTSYFLSLLSTFVLVLVISSCSGITDASHSVEKPAFEPLDMQDQGIREGKEKPDMIRIRPD